MRKASRWPLAAAAAVSVVCAGGLAQAQDIRSYIVTTASTGGTFYPVGVALASLWTERLRDLNVRASAISSAGSAENVAMMRTGEAEFAILGGYFGHIAYHGVEEFEPLGTFDEMRSITSLWPNVEMWLMLADAVETGTIEDVRGRRVNVGRPGSGTELYSVHTLRGLGIEPDVDVTFEYVGFFEAVDLMRDRRIDGANLGGGPPIAAITEAYTSLGADAVRLLSFTDEQLERIVESSPMPMYRYVLEADTYPGQTEPVEMIAQVTFLGVHADVEDEVVYRMTQAIFENLDYLHGIHDITRGITLDVALDGLPTPLHPGAYDYYTEVGLSIPDALVPPERE
jgi:uncharacterized protein